MSADASRRLAEYRKARDAQRNDGITARNEARLDAPRGLGDFQRRLNRDGRDNRRGQERSWNATPSRGGVGSLRGPKGTWEATPHNPNGEAEGWGQARNRRWDAPTPRAARDGSPDEIEAGFDMREWEEEQTKLDRDWYMTGEEGGVVSRYLVRFSGLLTLNRWEKKNTIRLPSGRISKSSSKPRSLQSRWSVPLSLYILVIPDRPYRRKYLRNKPNTSVYLIITSQLLPDL